MLSQRFSYDQAALRRKIARYYEMIKKPFPRGRGHCHGLSLLWLRRMAQNREQEFYSDIRKIVECPDHQLQNIANTIEHFFIKIDRRQNPESYQDLKYNQSNLDQIIKAKKHLVLDKTYLKATLGELFKIYSENGNMFYIANNKSYKINGQYARHGIAVFVREGQLYCYDSNYSSGMAKCFTNTIDLVSEIRIRLFSNLNLRIPPFMPLGLKMIQSKDLIFKPKPAPGLLQSLTTTLSYYYQQLPSLYGLFSNSDTVRNKRRIDCLFEGQENPPNKKRKLNL